MEKKKRGGKTLAISQAISIILSTIAFAYILASSFPVVSAQDQCVSVYNSGGTKIVRLPAGTTIAQYCEGKGTECGAATCPSSQTSAVPAIAVVPGVVNTVSNTLRLRGTTPTPVQQAAAPASAPTATGLKALMQKNLFSVNGLTPAWILSTAGWAATIYYGTKWVLSSLGASPELTSAASKAITIGYIAASITKQFFTGGQLPILGGLSSTVVGLIVAAILFVIFGGLTQHRVYLYQFSCNPWQAPFGGEKCEQCNKGDLSCTEYKCKSLGQACELVNQGTNNELCVWKDRSVNPAIIQPWREALTTGYKYVNDTAISPPDKGVKIVPEGDVNGCVAAWTRLKFGVTLNKPAICRIDNQQQRNFDDMAIALSSGQSAYNHTIQINLPGEQNGTTEEESIALENGGNMAVYTRCKDVNGNENQANFVFKFCVDKGPDTTPPLIVTTSILNGFPIASGQTSVDLQVYVNEPSECKWSRLDQAYDSMENQMTCSTRAIDVNAQGLYQCSTTLTGLKDGVNNDFYFRCKDQPHLTGTANESQRQVNSQSYKFTLRGTRSLVIDWVKPNGTIKDSTDIINVALEARTSAGEREGAARCFYKGFGTNDQFNLFFKTGTHQHSQPLGLPEGDYTYEIQCSDLGGNIDTKTTSFTVETDTEAPIVVRAFREGNFLKIITNEEASCVYSSTTANACNYLFEDGIAMQSLEKNMHQTAWNPDRTFYIKCEDDFGNQPLPNDCSIVAQPFGK
ncbi:MAG: hypothetical protein Q8P79_03715 [Nanoarchaeota archaeon]|nr:hypothetical protein [Nanoarchaeota archaeon]